MARLQDFQTVTPTASDKLLVVQSQGQGLVSYGSKLDTANPTGTGALSINRKANTTVGTYSATLGQNDEASGYISLATGQNTKASGGRSFAEGEGTEASGYTSHAAGVGTIANHKSQSVFGEFNVADTSTADSTARGNYVEIVGKGTANNARSNARTLDWSGNEVLAGDLMIMGNKSLNTAITTISTTVGTFSFYKYGKVVYCTMVAGTVTTNASGNIVISDSTTIIPDAYKPIANCETTAVLPSSARCTFRSSGEILLADYVSRTVTLRVSATWITS